MLSFSVYWHAQADRFAYRFSLVAEPAFDFDMNEPGSRRGAEGQAESGAKVFECSEFFAHRLTRAPQGIRPFGPDGGLGDSVFAYFFHQKSKAHKLAQQAARRLLF